MVIIVRHPWEVALSLTTKNNIELGKAHNLWLTYVRDSLRACQDQNHVLITFDQLLADPVSTLVGIGSDLNFKWSRDPRGFTSSLLDFVQPSLKYHHASNIADKDKHKYDAYKKIYQEVRLKQSFRIAESETVESHKLSPIEPTTSKTKGEIFVPSSLTAPPSLVDSLLELVGQYEKQMKNNWVERENIKVDPIRSQLFAEVELPTTCKDGVICKTFPLIVDEWQHITVSVPEPTLLQNKPIILKPLNNNGVVRISNIKIVNSDSGQILWSSETAKDYIGFVYNSSVIRLPDESDLLLFITNNDPEIELPCFVKIGNGPVTLDFWSKASYNQNIITKLLTVESDPKKRPVSGVKEHFINKLFEMSETWDFHNQFMLRVEEFRKLSQENKNSLIKCQTFWGKNINLYPKEPVSSNIFYFGFFEIGLTSFFVDFIKNGDVIIDIGAHIGFFSMLGSELVGDKGKVFSFEPTPTTNETLIKNLSSYPQAKIIQKCAWSSETKIEFHDFGAEFSAFNTATSARFNSEQKKQADDNLVLVDTTTIDSFTNELKIRPDLVKIDAENSEIHVLRGMTAILKNVRPVITIEVGDISIPNLDGLSTSRELLEFVMDFGYFPLESVGARYQAHYLKTEKYSYNNIIMVPEERLPIRRPIGTVAVQKGKFF
jgi:FkbM family methyltransferase